MDMEFLKRSGLLATLSDEDLRVLLDCTQRRAFQKDQEVLLQGQGNASLFVVQQGTLHAHRKVKSRRVFLGRLEPGSAFGEVSLFDPGPTSATVSGVTDGTLIEIRREHLETFAAKRPDAAVRLLSNLISQMARRMRETDERLVDSVVWGGLVKS
jgi:CRP/FNR family cyclic AMP-dependent transcriptional regulator